MVTDRASAGEQALPSSAMLRGASRLGFLTLRPGIGLEAGNASPTLALRGAVAVLTPLSPDARFGFFGVEMEADWGRFSPYSVAANVVADLTPVDIPLRLGLALPWTLGADSTAASLGLYFRLFYVSDREQAYGRKTGSKYATNVTVK